MTSRVSCDLPSQLSFEEAYEDEWDDSLEAMEANGSSTLLSESVDDLEAATVGATRAYAGPA